MTKVVHESDARTARSRSQLKSALLELLGEKPFSQIRTKEIAGRARIHRVTFYDHYAAKEDLLEELIDDVLTEYADIIESTPSNLIAQWPPMLLVKTIRQSIRHIGKHAEFYRILLLTNGVPDLTNRLHDQMSRSLHVSLGRMSTKHADIDYDLFIDWIIGGAIAIYKHWLQSGMKQTEEDIAKQMLRITLAAGQVFNPRRVIL
ncbi:TetR/AcrR family transcriptional regulator [Paenibacillus sacheonensis]|uniref:TetR family transcriptional regulator n=1 Tax=Paenibacillus sacheonensis TaxID=742054 RepID=A0A7X4YT97_9BACL|nr:TetR/AcrR family transcriptional regulator [Paenibacillus sacheonensis]MBM7568405.1 AcrR family transcriptional regulator [Paenibacillus sacheonensis]NBC72103.1 TetR family transcriptional regulator [Paenibacillus sacheonensis]